MRMLIGAGALVVALLAPNAAAQMQSECDDAHRVIASQPADKGNLDALIALSRLVPAACARQQAMLQAIIAAAQATPDWVFVDRDGIVRPVDPPAEPAWAADAEIWPRMLSDADMLVAPTQAQIDALHPPRALDRGRFGAVILEGRVREDGTIAWRPARASPAGWGFEAAALHAAAIYVAPLTFADGRTTIGSTFRAVIRFTRQPDRVVYFH
jgi:hypothetical protein